MHFLRLLLLSPLPLSPPKIEETHGEALGQAGVYILWPTHFSPPRALPLTSALGLLSKDILVSLPSWVSMDIGGRVRISFIPYLPQDTRTQLSQPGC